MENPTVTEAQQHDLPASMIADADLMPADDGGGLHYRTFCPDIRVHADGQRATVQIMTGQKARDRMILEPKGLDVRNFKKNPVMLWHHGWDVNGRVPIGTIENIRLAKDGKSWLGDPLFDEDEFSQMIGGKVARKVVRALSIGWITHEKKYDEENDTIIITRSELTEVSFVSVGSDPNALVRQWGGYMDLSQRLQALENKFASTGATVPAENGERSGAEVQPAKVVEPVSTQREAPQPVQPAPIDYRNLVSMIIPQLQESISNAVETAIDQRTGKIL